MRMETKHVAAAARLMGCDVQADTSGLSEAEYLQVGDYKIRFATHETRPTYGITRGYADFEVGDHQDANSSNWISAVVWLSRQIRKTLPASVVRVWVRERLRAEGKLEAEAEVLRQNSAARHSELQTEFSAKRDALLKEFVRACARCREFRSSQMPKPARKLRARLREALRATVSESLLFAIETNPAAYLSDTRL